MLVVTEPKGPDERGWESDRGSLTIRRPRLDLIVFVEAGHLEEGFAPLIEEASNQALECKLPLHIFVDAYDLTGYAPSVRKGPTDWLNRNRASVAVQHMLVRSKLTKMGLSVASLALGGLLRGHASRASFRQALEDTLQDLSRQDQISAR